MAERIPNSRDDVAFIAVKTAFYPPRTKGIHFISTMQVRGGILLAITRDRSYIQAENALRQTGKVFFHLNGHTFGFHLSVDPAQT